MLSDQSPPEFPSILMTVSATPSDTTVPVLQYRITLNGIKVNIINEGETLIPEICIVRSLGKDNIQLNDINLFIFYSYCYKTICKRIRKY